MSGMGADSSSVVALASLAVGYYLFHYLHEYAHYFAGRVFSGRPEPVYGSWRGIPYPRAVEYRNLEAMPAYGVRVTGIAPHLLWTGCSIVIARSIDASPVGPDVATPPVLSPLLVAGATAVSVPPLELTAVTATALAAISVSPSDLVATFRPERYRRFKRYGFSQLGWAAILIFGQPYPMFGEAR